MDRLDEGEAEDPHGGLGWYPGGDDTAVASASTALDESNKGFQLLAKMGWSRGRGLGRNEDGALGWGGAGQRDGRRGGAAGRRGGLRDGAGCSVVG
jgi:hypothetical protein